MYSDVRWICARLNNKSVPWIRGKRACIVRCTGHRSSWFMGLEALLGREMDRMILIEVHMNGYIYIIHRSAN